MVGAQKQDTGTRETAGTPHGRNPARPGTRGGAAGLMALVGLGVLLYANSRLPVTLATAPAAASTNSAPAGRTPTAPAVADGRAPAALPPAMPAAPTTAGRNAGDSPDATAIAASQARLAGLTAGYQTALAATATAAGPAPATAAPTAPPLPTVAPALPTAASPPPAATAPIPATAPPTPPTPLVLPALLVHAFVQRAAPANITANGTAIDKAAVPAGDPILLITANGNPGGGPRVSANHVTGVYESAGQWLVYHQDLALMAPGTAFNVAVLSAGPATTIGRSTPANTTGADTLLDIPAANDHPDAIVLVTSNWNPGVLSGVYNNHPLGVAYGAGRWHVLNADGAPMPLGAAFNVLVLPPGATSFVQRAPAAAGAADALIVDNPLANNHPDAILIVTANHTPGSTPDGADAHVAGVEYVAGHWRIFHADGTPLPPGVGFNVAVLLP